MHSTPTFGFGFALMVEVLVMVSCTEFFPGPSEVSDHLYTASGWVTAGKGSKSLKLPQLVRASSNNLPMNAYITGITNPCFFPSPLLPSSLPLKSLKKTGLGWCDSVVRHQPLNQVVTIVFRQGTSPVWGVKEAAGH